MCGPGNAPWMAACDLLLSVARRRAPTSERKVTRAAGRRGKRHGCRASVVAASRAPGRAQARSYKSRAAIIPHPAKVVAHPQAAEGNNSTLPARQRPVPDVAPKKRAVETD